MIISSRKVGGNFNPRPPCGGRRWSAWQSWSQASFQSTPPVRGATHPRLPAVFTGRISIHAPRAGGDLAISSSPLAMSNFNPRPPCGGRRSGLYSASSITEFQSTPPVRGATWTRLTVERYPKFQSTPPVRGATWGAALVSGVPLVFQSTPPVRGATCRSSVPAQQGDNFNPRPPCGGRRENNV